ncbi:23S rRNA (cytidine2498-2'-O)-methyltransferase [Fontibacillus phaseoli]|uniref:23S rRNA (Cytidine2498-2'-O)-methyltransferase n=2 Tax=Fontibacillus phaseoli TaxID=1416533 RepID=A0A369BS75_9BACL|nr:23S rRNA (cytidine2498-2'-O)-methyltransferase [Fontibacillus phaseoli]
MNNEMERENRGESAVASRYLCTANHGFAPYAQEELRRRFGAVKSTILVPGEVFVATLQASFPQVVQELSHPEPMFLRHMFPVQWEWKAENKDHHGQDQQEDWMTALQQFLLNDSRLSGKRLALQTRKTEQSLWAGSAAELKDAVQSGIGELGSEFVVRNAELIISVFAAKESIYAGVSLPEENLSDWNGGAVRFQREEGQISRAKFKLLEAEAVFGIDFAAFHEALDIGAAPGGWTSFLLERGLRVTAVDPAKLHPDVLSSPGLTHLKKNANNVKFRDNQFDMLVCDMSWSPKLTARMVSDLLYALVPGGTAVVTVKLLSKKPMALITEVIGMFQEARLQVQRAKQLFHNRDEITLYMIKY